MPDKFEREIEDILNKLDKFPRLSPAQRLRRNVFRRISSGQQHLAARLSRLSIAQIMLSGMVLVIVGYLFRAILVEVWYYMVVFGLILFFTALVLSFAGGRRGSGPTAGGQVYWRGRPVQSYYSSGSSLAERLRQWLRRHQGRR